MVKYGKEFRRNQKIEWKDKYFDYKAYKKKIKSLMTEKNKEEFILKSEFDKENEIEQWTFKFEENLDKDIKKIYVFYALKEKELYKKSNKCLYMKDDYSEFALNDYLEHYKDLYELSLLSLDLSKYVYYNLKAVLKILKKYDKKIIGNEYKKLQIKIKYINAKIEDQNSDILYLLKFKMIDEINLLLEDLIKNLKEQFKQNKNQLKLNEDDESENKLIDEIADINQAKSIIRQNDDKIKTNIKEIDKVSAKITSLFTPWKKFLRISSDMNSKLLQITREKSFSHENSNIHNRAESIVESINISKETKYNILIILLHGFLYMYSYSVVIPLYNSIFSSSFFYDNNDKVYLMWGLLMMMAPIGSLFNYIYETFFFKKSTKKPIIISCIGLIIGNLLYSFASYFGYAFFLFIGRFLIGLFNLRTHNKMFIINFLLRKDVSFYLTMFHTFSMIGLSSGFLINLGLYFININDIKLLNKYTIGTLVGAALSFILLILTFILFTEAHSKYFNMTSLQMFGEGILNDIDNEDIIDEINKNNKNRNNEEEKAGILLKKKTLILKGIDEQLGNFNIKNKFNDTNLVSQSVYKLANEEENSLNYLFKSYIVYLFIIITTKFINESIYINSFIFNEKVNLKPEDNNPWEIPLALGGSCILSLLVELSLSCKNIFISEKNLLIILLFFLFINNGFFVLFHFLEKNFYFYYFFIIDNILANLTEKYTAHLFLYIIPDNYHLCRIHGNILINILSMISRILCASLLIILDIVDFNKYCSIMYITMTSLSFISLFLYLIDYQDIRIKAIRRIMNNMLNDEIKIATEV